ncbi:MAG TPA: radical SAM protein [Thermoanaerobaculia bacterium]|nr:radical SAM protein [Thermoanaerobaculia bacterium]
MSYSFSMLYFEATRRCNLRCPMCMTSSNDAQRVRESHRRELSLDEIRSQVLVPAKNLGIVAVGWSGGEFLLREDAFDLLRLTTSMGFRTNICSNCELLDRDMLIRIRDATDGKGTIAVGLNSLDEDNRDTRNAETARTLAVLDLCAEVGLDRHVIITIGRYNTESFERTVKYVVDRGISYNRSPLVPRGSGCGGWEGNRFSRDDLRDDFHPTLRKYVNGYVSYTPYFLSPELHAKYSGGVANNTVPQNPPIGCWCGNWLTINAEGDVSFCPVLLDAISAGNVREKPLERLVNESEMFARITDRTKLGGKCGRCRYKFTCGGCRAMALYHNGDIMGEDPTCFFEPADETTVSEHEAETNRVFKQYLIVAGYSGFYKTPRSRRDAKRR